MRRKTARVLLPHAVLVFALAAMQLPDSGQSQAADTMAEGGNSTSGYDMAPQTRPEVVAAAVAALPTKIPSGPFQPTWESLKQNYRVPRWCIEVKFGLFLHWGLYESANLDRIRKSPTMKPSSMLLSGLLLLGAVGCAHHPAGNPAAAHEEVSLNAAPKAPAMAPAPAVPGRAPAPDLASNPPPRVAALNPALPTLFVAGDSTAARGAGEAQQGWAIPFADYFDRSKLNVLNRARGGRSSRTFITEGLWEQLLADVKAGDIVLIQFGHNDAGAINDAARARGSLRGLGEETEEIDNLITKQHEVVHSYGWYLRKFIADTRAKGATPIVCSLVPRKTWKDGKIVRSKDTYAGWAEAAARSENAAFVDLNELIARRYDELGPAEVEPLFGDEHTHTSAAGAELNAQCVITGLKALQDNPLAPYLRAN
jgi:lysophospholipase L1-like esterase